MLTQERLKQVLSYDPDTGVFVWLSKPNRRVVVGSVAGALVGRFGYRGISVDGRRYYTHRLAVLYMTGAWPTETVDHKNGVPGDDRWCNLREASRSQNSANRKAQSHSRAGLKGAIWHKQSQKWVSALVHKGRSKFLGKYDTPEAAHAAYMKAARELHGEFARPA